jgi:type IV secretory pathway VirB10-like protein
VLFPPQIYLFIYHLLFIIYFINIYLNQQEDVKGKEKGDVDDEEMAKELLVSDKKDDADKEEEQTDDGKTGEKKDQPPPQPLEPAKVNEVFERLPEETRMSIDTHRTLPCIANRTHAHTARTAHTHRSNVGVCGYSGNGGR